MLCSHDAYVDGKTRDVTLELDHFDWEVLFPHAENLETAENRLFRLGMAVDTHAEKIALILPIQPTLDDCGCVSKYARRLDKCAASLFTSETLNRFFWRRTARPGKLSSVTRAGWLDTSGVQ